MQDQNELLEREGDELRDQTKILVDWARSLKAVSLANATEKYYANDHWKKAECERDAGIVRNGLLVTEIQRWRAEAERVGQERDAGQRKLQRLASQLELQREEAERWQDECGAGVLAAQRLAAEVQHWRAEAEHADKERDAGELETRRLAIDVENLRAEAELAESERSVGMLTTQRLAADVESLRAEAERAETERSARHARDAVPGGRARALALGCGKLDGPVRQGIAPGHGSPSRCSRDQRASWRWRDGGRTCGAHAAQARRRSSVHAIDIASCLKRWSGHSTRRASATGCCVTGNTRRLACRFESTPHATGVRGSCDPDAMQEARTLCCASVRAPQL